MNSTTFRLAPSQWLSLLLAGALAQPWGLAFAADKNNASVVQGTATFDNSVPNELLINPSDGAVLHWDAAGNPADPGFSIGATETVNFSFDSAGGKVLNNIMVAVPSTIAGTLTSNGTVYLVNPAGITFVNGAVIDVAGIIAAAAKAVDLDTWNSLRDGGAATLDLVGDIENMADIDLAGPDAQVTLLALHILNGPGGSISAPQGTTMMVAGEQAILNPGGGVLVRVFSPTLAPGSDPAENPSNRRGFDGDPPIPGGAPGVPGIDNQGSIGAPTGRVHLAVGDVYSVAFQQSGTTTGGEVSVVGEGNLELPDGVTGNTSLLVQAGASGDGDLSFENDAIVTSPDLTLRAGDGNGGAGTASEIDFSGNPELRGTGDGTSPDHFTVRQDAAIADAPDGVLDGGPAGVDYTLQSDDGNVTVATGSRVAGSGLTLDGESAVDINDDLNLASLLVADAATADGDLIASDGLIFEGSLTLDGAGPQTVDAGAGLLDAASDVEKATGGLTVAGDAGIEIGGDLIGNLTIENDLTLDGAGAQTVDAQGGTLDAQGSIEKTAGTTLTVAGDAGIEVAGDLTSTDGLVVENDLTLDGAGPQRVDAGAGTLDAAGFIDKTTGAMTLGGATGIEVAGDITSGSGITLEDGLTLDGAGPQTVDAGTGALDANGSITKTNGAVTLAGDGGISAGGDLTGVGLTIEDTLTLDGGGAQLVTAVGGTLDAQASVAKTAGSGLTVVGGTSIQVAGDLTSTNGLTIQNALTLDGPGAQRVDAGAGTLDAASSITKPTGATTLGGGSGIEVAGDVTSDSGITLEDSLTLDGAGPQTVDAGTGALDANGSIDSAGAVTLAGDAGLLVADDVTTNGLTLANDLTADGAGAQRIDAGTGTLDANGSISKTTGQLTLGGAAGIDAVADVTSGAGLVVEDDLTLSAAAPQRVDAGTGTLDAAGSITKTNGVLTLGGGTAIQVAGDIGSGAGLIIEDDLTLDGAGTQTLDAGTGTLDALGSVSRTGGALNVAGDAGISVAGDLTATNGLGVQNDLTLDGAGAQRVDAGAGTLDADGFIDKPAGAMTLGGATAIDVAGNVTAGNGITVEDDLTLSAVGVQTVDAGTGTLDVNGDVIKATGGLTVAGAAGIFIEGELTGNLTIDDDLTLDGSGAQRVDAQAGLLDAAGFIRKTAGTTLTVAGDAGIQVAGDLSSMNGLVVENDLTLDGAGAQRVDAGAGTLDAAGFIDKTTGAMTLGGASGIEVAGDITSAAGITLEDGLTLDGAGPQKVDAGTGTLDANGSIRKNNGAVTLAGDSGISVAGDMEAIGLTVENTLTLDGGGSQHVDARTGTLDAQASVQKTAGTLLIVSGDAGVEVAGDLTSTGGLNVQNDLTLDGAGAQRVDAGAGTLDAAGSIDKPVGALTLGGANGIEVAGDVGSAAGLTIEDDLTADGGASQTLDAGTGVLDVNGDIDAPVGVSLQGDAGISLGGDVSGGDIEVADDATLDGSGNQSLVADDVLAIGGNVDKTSDGKLTLEAGTQIDFTSEDAQSVSANDDLTLRATDPKATDGEEFSSVIKPRNSLTLESRDGAVDIESKVTVAGVDEFGNPKPNGSGDLTILAENGGVTITDLTANGSLVVDSPSITLSGRKGGGDSFTVKGKPEKDSGADYNARDIKFTSKPKFSSGGSTYTFGTPNGNNVSSNILSSSAIKRQLITGAGGFDTFGPAFNNDIVPIGPSGGPVETAVSPPILVDPTEDEVPDLVDVPGGTEGPVRATDVILFLQCVKLEGDTSPLPEDCPEEYSNVAEVTQQGTPAVSAVGPTTEPDARVGQQVTTARPLGSSDRPANSPQINALRIYRQLRSEPVQPVIAQAVEAYKLDTGSDDVSGKDFRRYVDGSPSHAQAAVYLSEMQDLLGALGGAGMSPAQYLKAARKVLEEMSPDNLPAQQLGEAVRGDGSAQLPAFWPDEVAELERGAPRS